jgi:alpha/beta superfamily hydrolase
LEFDLASQNGLLSCVVPEIESWKVFHFIGFSFGFWIGEPFADHEKETRAILANHQEKS